MSMLAIMFANSYVLVICASIDSVQVHTIVQSVNVSMSDNFGQPFPNLSI